MNDTRWTVRDVLYWLEFTAYVLAFRWLVWRERRRKRCKQKT